MTIINHLLLQNCFVACKCDSPKNFPRIYDFGKKSVKMKHPYGIVLYPTLYTLRQNYKLSVQFITSPNFRTHTTRNLKVMGSNFDSITIKNDFFLVLPQCDNVDPQNICPVAPLLFPSTIDFVMCK